MPRLTALAVSSAALAMLLTACGGGGTAPPPTPSIASPSSVTNPSVGLTVAQYQALRPPAAAVRAEDVAKARALAIDRVVSQLVAAEAKLAPTVLNDATWAVYTVATDVARLQLLTAAASGDTARELQPLVSAEALGSVGAVLTQPLRREAMVRPGTSFTAKFWMATEAQAGVASVGAWSSREADLATSPMDLAWLGGGHEARLVVQDTLATVLGWPSAAATTAVFLNDQGQRYTASALRISGRISSVSAADYRAESVAVAGWTLIKLMPNNGETLSSFGGRRLAGVFKELIDGMPQPAAQGELLLPVLGPTSASDRVFDVDVPGANLVFNADYADLSALDGLGGQYAKAAAVAPRLDVGLDGLRLEEKAWLGFAFNPKNIHAPTTSLVGYQRYTPDESGMFEVDPLPLCPAGAAVLRSFYLALLDEHGVLQALAPVRGVKRVERCR